MQAFLKPFYTPLLVKPKWTFFRKRIAASRGVPRGKAGRWRDDSNQKLHIRTPRSYPFDQCQRTYGVNSRQLETASDTVKNREHRQAHESVRLKPIGSHQCMPTLWINSFRPVCRSIMPYKWPTVSSCGFRRIISNARCGSIWRQKPIPEKRYQHEQNTFSESLQPVGPEYLITGMSLSDNAVSFFLWRDWEYALGNVRTWDRRSFACMVIIELLIYGFSENPWIVMFACLLVSVSWTDPRT